MDQPKKDKSKLLYEAVSKDYDLGTYDEFKTKLQDDTKREAFFNGVGQEYKLGTYEEFESKLSPLLKKKIESQSTSENQDLVSVQEVENGSSDSPQDETGQLVKDLDAGKLDERINTLSAENKLSEEKQAEKEANYSVSKELFRSLAKGSSRLGRNIAATPELLYDIFAIPQNALANKENLPLQLQFLSDLLGGEDLATDSEKFKELVGAENVIKDYYSNQIDNITKEQEEKDKFIIGDITTNIRQGNYSDSFRMISKSIAESLPSTMGIMLSGGTSTPAQVLGGVTTVFAADSNEEYKKENPEMGTNERVIKSLGKGFAEGVFSTIGSSKIGVAAKEIIAKEGKKEGAKILKAQLVNMYTEALKKYSIPSAMIGEGIEEAATQMTQNAIDGKPIMEGVSDSFIVGSASGGAFGVGLEGIKKISKNNVTPSDIENVEATKDKAEAIKSELSEQVKEGDLTPKEAKDYFDNWEEIKNDLQAVPEEFTPEQKAKSIEVIKKKKILEQEIKGKDPALVEDKKAKIEELNNELKNIKNTDAKVEENTTETKEQAVETTTPDTNAETVQEKGVEDELSPTVELNPENTNEAQDNKPVKVTQFKKGDGGTKGVFKSEDGKLYKSVTPLEKNIENGKVVYNEIDTETKEHKFLSENQDLKHLPKVGKIVETSEGKAFEIEELQEVEKGSLTLEEINQVNKTLTELNKRNVAVNDNNTVMRRKNGDIVLIDLSSASENNFKDNEITSQNIIDLLNPKDQSKYNANNASNNLIEQKELFDIKDKQEFAYLLTQRPPSIGTHPDGQIKDAEELKLGNRTVYRVTYSNPLSKEDVNKFELVEEITDSDTGRVFQKGSSQYVIRNVNGENEIEVTQYFGENQKTQIYTQKGFRNLTKDANESTPQSNTKPDANIQLGVDTNIQQREDSDVQTAIDGGKAKGEVEVKQNIDHAIKEVNKGILAWDGNPFSSRVDLGISRADVRKGESDIKKGNYNTVPAKRVIEALAQVKKQGYYDYMEGSGGKTRKIQVPLTEILDAEIELEVSELEEINKNEDALAKEHEVFFNNLDEATQNEILENYENRENNSGEVQSDSKIGEGKNDVQNKQEPKQEDKGDQVDNSPPKTPKEKSNDDFKRKSGKKSLLNRLIDGGNGKDITSTLESLGKDYDVRNQEDVDEYANAFIDKVGLGEALHAAQNGLIPNNDVKYLVYAEALEQLKNEIDKESNVNDRDGLIEQFQQLSDKFDNDARNAGQGIAILNYIYNKNQNLKYSLSKQIADYKASDPDGKIPDDILEKYKKLDEKLHELEKQTKEAEERAEKAEEELAIKNIQEDIERKKSIESRKRTSKAKAAKILANKVRTVKIHKPNIFSSATPASLVWDGAIEIVAKTIEGGGKIADAVQKGLEYIKGTDWYKGLSKKDKKEAETSFEDSINKSAKPPIPKAQDGEPLNVPNSLVRYYVEQGYDDINEISALIKEDIVEEYPDADIRDIRDAITGYGKQINPSKNEITAKINKLKEYGRLLSAYDDVLSGTMPFKSGLIRPKTEQKSRELRREVNRLAKELELQSIDPETQWANALDKIKSNLKNQIEDLDKQIAKGEKRKIERNVIKLDEEAENLKKIRNEKRKILDDLVGKPELSDAEKIAKAETLLERAIEKLQKEIDNNDIAFKERNTPLESSKLKSLREQQRALKNTKAEMRELAGLIEKQRLQTSKKRIRNQIEEYKRRLREKDFSKKEANIIKADSELDAIRAEREAIFEEYEKEKHRQELKNRSTKQKWIDAILEGFAVGRALKASLDLGLIGIQLRHFTYREILNSPRGFTRKLVKMFQSIGSQSKADKARKLLLANPEYSLANKLDIGLTNPDLRDEVREEASAGSLLSFAWKLPMIAVYNLGGKRGKKFARTKRKSIGDTFIDGFKRKYNEVFGANLEINDKEKFSRIDQWKNLNLFRNVERGLSTYGNQIRFEEFLRGVQRLRNEGKDEINHKEDYEALASYIRTFSGRAKPAGFEMNQKALNLFFFSFKNAASVFQQLNPVYYGYLQGKTADNKDGKIRFKPTVANRMAMTSMLRTTAANIATIMFIMAGYAAIKDEEDDEMTLETDPRSSDFGKLRIGSFRYDPWGGYMPLIVLYARLFSEEVKKQDQSEYIMGESYTGVKNRFDAIQRFAFNKEAPITSMFHKYLTSTEAIDEKTGETYRKTPYGGKLSEDDAYSAMPIFLGSIKEAVDNDYDDVKWFLTGYSVLGLGNTQDYGESKKKKSTKPKKPKKPKKPRKP